MTYKKRKSLDVDWITQTDAWISKEAGKTAMPIEWAIAFAKFLVAKGSKDINGNVVADFTCYEKPLTTSQIRKFFGVVKKIQAEGYDKNKVKLAMLEPQLAYAVGKDKKYDKEKQQIVSQTKILYFYEEISLAIRAIQQKEHFQNFVNLLEAIVAYHKAEGGKDNANS
jgi:CRISPR type III-A-associated protein Csm2